jgi:predicted XRE-type DNA-binding protein
MREKVEVISGSGNVFRDLGKPHADLSQARAILAAKIIGVLDDRKLSLRAAESVTGVDAAEFSRIRTANLGRFTIDRMIKILGKLGQEVNVEVTVRPMAGQGAGRHRQGGAAVPPPARGSRSLLKKAKKTGSGLSIRAR